jgi:hypothetical protein
MQKSAILSIFAAFRTCKECTRLQVVWATIVRLEQCILSLLTVSRVTHFNPLLLSKYFTVADRCDRIYGANNHNDDAINA